MNKKLSREEKEKLYIIKMTELQIRFGNPIDNDWDFSDWTDEQLDRGLENAIGQLKFENKAVLNPTCFKKGDYVLIQGGFVVMKIEKKEAEQSLKLYHDALD